MKRRKFMQLTLGAAVVAPTVAKAIVSSGDAGTYKLIPAKDNSTVEDDLERRLLNGETIEGEEFILNRIINWDVDAPYLVINCKITFNCPPISSANNAYIHIGNVPSVHIRRIMYCEFDINYIEPVFADYRDYRNTTTANIEIVQGELDQKYGIPMTASKWR